MKRDVARLSHVERRLGAVFKHVPVHPLAARKHQAVEKNRIAELQILHILRAQRQLQLHLAHRWPSLR